MSFSRTRNRAVVLMLAVALTACGGGSSDGGGGAGAMAFSPAKRENVAPGVVYVTPNLQVTKVSRETIPVSTTGVERLLVNGVEVEPDKAEVRTGDRLNLAIKAPDAFGKTHTATLRIADKTLEYTLKTGTSKLRFERNRARKALVFEWDDLDVTRYRLLHNPDGNSGYTPVLEITGNAARAEMPVTITQLDWERGMFAVEACLSPDASCVMLPGHEVALKQPQSVEMINYIKPLPVGDDNDFTDDYFGDHMALSADGQMLAVSVLSDQGGTSGAVQIFRKGKDGWAHETTLTAPDDTAPFGRGAQSLSLNTDGNVLAVAQYGASNTDRAFVYRRSTSGWTQEAAFTGSINQAIRSIVLSPSGERLIAGESGKFDVHDRQADGSWLLRQSLADSAGGNCGDALALSEDARTLVMSDRFHNSRQGRVLVYRDSDGDGEYEAPPASMTGENSAADDSFGYDVTLNSNGTLMLVGAGGEDANRGDPASNGNDTPLRNSGAAYVFERIVDTNDWRQVAYLKAPNADAFDQFGVAVAMSADAQWLAIGASSEQGSATGIHTPGTVLDENGEGNEIGAVYLYERNGTQDWQLRRYVKSPENSEADGDLGFGAQIALSADGATLVVTAPFEDGAGTGVDEGDPADNSMENAGAVYIY